MINKLFIYKKHEFYFNYGIFTNQDYELVDSIIKVFDNHFSSMFPVYKNYNLFSKIMNIFEKNKTLNIDQISIKDMQGLLTYAISESRTCYAICCYKMPFQNANAHTHMLFYANICFYMLKYLK
jgi:hypothetical protein